MCEPLNCTSIALPTIRSTYLLTCLLTYLLTSIALSTMSSTSCQSPARKYCHTASRTRPPHSWTSRRNATRKWGRRAVGGGGRAVGRGLTQGGGWGGVERWGGAGHRARGGGVERWGWAGRRARGREVEPTRLALQATACGSAGLHCEGAGGAGNGPIRTVSRAHERLSDGPRQRRQVDAVLCMVCTHA